MTDGEPAKTEPWIEKMGVRYAYAYDRSGYAARTGVVAYPYALLVSPGGVVLWKGHPSQLDEHQIERQLGRTLDVPLFEWPAALRPVAAAAAAGRWTDAVAGVEKLVAGDASMAPWRDRVTCLIRQQIHALDRLADNGDAFRAWQRAHTLHAALAGVARSQQSVTESIERWGKDRDFVTRYRVQQRVHELEQAPFDTVAEAEPVMAELAKIAADHPDTLVAREAAMIRGYFQALIDHGQIK